MVALGRDLVEIFLANASPSVCLHRFRCRVNQRACVVLRVIIYLVMNMYCATTPPFGGFGSQVSVDDAVITLWRKDVG